MKLSGLLFLPFSETSRWKSKLINFNYCLKQKEQQQWKIPSMFFKVIWFAENSDKIVSM